MSRSKHTDHDARLRVYCSGPLFSPEERAAMVAIAAVFEAEGCSTYLPQRDGVEAVVLPLAGGPLDRDVPGPRAVLDRAIFAVDVYQLIECCDGVVINLNGRVPDEGAVVEAALAYAAGVPVVAYKNDARAPFRGHDNSMLEQLVRSRVNRIDALPAKLRATARPARPECRLSEAVQDAVATGRRLWPLVCRAIHAGILQDHARELVGEIARELARVEPRHPG